MTEELVEVGMAVKSWCTAKTAKTAIGLHGVSSKCCSVVDITLSSSVQSSTLCSPDHSPNCYEEMVLSENQ